MNSRLTRSFRIEGDAGARLDLAIFRHLAALQGARRISRTQVQEWVAAGRVRVNGEPAAKASHRLAAGDEVEVRLPPPPRTGPEAPELAPLEMSLSVLYEDDHLLALDKPPGIVVHPSSGHRDITLLHGLLWRARDWREGQRPHFVSRLDKGTSGILLVAKDGAVHTAAARALRRPGAEKDYLALVYGRTELAKGRIDLRIGRDPAEPKRRIASIEEGQPSATLWEKLAESPTEPLTLLRCRLLTGRTHQIRVHLQARRLPIVGDPLYGPAEMSLRDPELAAACRDLQRQALHAWRLALAHPVTGERLELSAPLPPDLAGLLARAGVSPG